MMIVMIMIVILVLAMLLVMIQFKFFVDVLTERGDGKLNISQMERGKKQIKTKANLNTKLWK